VKPFESQPHRVPSAKAEPAPSPTRRQATPDGRLEPKLALLASTNPGAFHLVVAIIEGALSAGAPARTVRSRIH
jgi:hypothetical protein